MTGLSTGLDTELAKPAALVFGAVEILLPGYSLRLVDGAGHCVIGGNAYVGRDATYGVLGAVESMSDGVDNSAPMVRITLLPPSNTATATLADPAAQGSKVTIWFGAIDPSTGLVIADPDLIGVYELDVPIVEVKRNSRALQYDCVSAFERMFDQDEGVKLNGPWHASIWPGELGLQYTTSVLQQLPWGQDAPRPVLITDIPVAVSPGAAALARFGGAGFSPFY